jgi:hypothetical protein
LASITTGDSSTCAETLTAATYCWGDNTYGQVGDATNTQRKIPTAVSAAYSSVINGEYHACGLNASGIAYCWGDDTYGEIGDAQSGAGIKVNTPTLVGGSITFRQLDAGAYETCGVSTGNVIYCWGYNNYGQIGDTTTTMRTAPATGAFTPSVSISIGNASITEGNSGTATLNVPLTLSGTTSAAVVVKYSTTDVTATAGVDYTSATNAVANIPAGSTTANIAVAVSGDAVYEPDETFTVTLSQVSYNSRWSTTQGTGTILNDDVQPPPTLTFSLSGVTSGTTCNGITTTATSTATGFALYPSASAASSTALSASVTTNAGNGYSLYAKFLATPASGSHTLAAHSGTNTNPVAAFPTGTEAFGYTTDDTTLSNTGAGISRFAGPKWAGLNTTDAEIAGATSQGTETSCQVYQVNQSTTSPAGRYAGTIIYTVVPHF